MPWLLRHGILRRDCDRDASLHIPPIYFYLIHSLKRDNRPYRGHSDTFRPGADQRNRDHVEGGLLHAFIMLRSGALVPHSVVVSAP